MRHESLSWDFQKKRSWNGCVNITETRCIIHPPIDVSICLAFLWNVLYSELWYTKIKVELMSESQHNILSVWFNRIRMRGEGMNFFFEEHTEYLLLCKIPLMSQVTFCIHRQIRFPFPLQKNCIEFEATQKCFKGIMPLISDFSVSKNIYL